MVDWKVHDYHNDYKGYGSGIKMFWVARSCASNWPLLDIGTVFTCCLWQISFTIERKSLPWALAETTDGNIRGWSYLDLCRSQLWQLGLKEFFWPLGVSTSKLRMVSKFWRASGFNHTMRSKVCCSSKTWDTTDWAVSIISEVVLSEDHIEAAARSNLIWICSIGTWFELQIYDSLNSFRYVIHLLPNQCKLL